MKKRTTIQRAFVAWLIDNEYTTREDIVEELQEEVIGIGETLPKGSYKLTQDIFAGDEGEIKGKKGDIVVAFAEITPTDSIMGQNIFKVVHQKSKNEIYVSLEDLKEK